MPIFLFTTNFPFVAIGVSYLIVERKKEGVVLLTRRLRYRPLSKFLSLPIQTDLVNKQREREEEESSSIADANIPVNDPPYSTTRVHRLASTKVNERRFFGSIGDQSSRTIVDWIDRGGKRERKRRKGESSFVPRHTIFAGNWCFEYWKYFYSDSENK